MCTVRNDHSEATFQGLGHGKFVQESGQGHIPAYTLRILERSEYNGKIVASNGTRTATIMRENPFPTYCNKTHEGKQP